MNQIAQTKTVQVEPGSAILYLQPIQLTSVVSFGIVISMYDKLLKIGGLCHFIYPGYNQSENSGKYSFSAITSQLRMFKNAGSAFGDIQIKLFGASQHPTKDQKYLTLAHFNYQSAVEILSKANLNISSIDIGGEKGRKIRFNTSTGECHVSSVLHLRESDWQTK